MKKAMGDGGLHIVLAGNPNSGKSTIFNNLTGAKQHIANYPGVTVEIKEGSVKYKGEEIKIVDLPGTYSLTAYSPEELIARNYIIEKKPDLVVDVIDSSNLERNLYLAVQLMELDVPLVFLFNQSDIAKKRGIEFDLDGLSNLLGIPIIATVGSKNIGTDKILDTVLEASRQKQNRAEVTYCDEMDAEIRKIKQTITDSRPSDYIMEHLHWIVVKLLENDPEVRIQVIEGCKDSEKVLFCVSKSREFLKKMFNYDSETIIADRRYGFVSGICKETVKFSVHKRHDISDKIDTIVISRLLGLPLFFLLMYFVFYLTFTLGTPPMEWISSFFGSLGDLISGFWPEGSDSYLRSLLVDGIIGGVGGVIVFLPNILFLFLAIAVLEDSGYMARAAFVMDKLMHKIGLHGKSFIPMITGFGCSIPGILATRTLEHKHDRLTTMMVVPLMSCGARFPIYALIIPAFFAPKWQAPVLWLIYIIGIVLAVISAKLLRLVVFKGENTPFVMELPPYRIPTLKGLFIHTWRKSWLYLKKAGTIILGISVVMWVLVSFPKLPKKDLERFSSEPDRQQAQMSHSFAGRIGRSMEPVIRHIGFDWRIGTALVGAVAAKEVFVSQLGVVYSVGKTDEDSESLRSKLQKAYNPLIGFCIMIFCLISSPCLATFAVTKKESGSYGWAFFQFFGLTFLAYIFTFIIYQLGLFFKIGV